MEDSITATRAERSASLVRRAAATSAGAGLEAPPPLSAARRGWLQAWRERNVSARGESVFCAMHLHLDLA